MSLHGTTTPRHSCRAGAAGDDVELERGACGARIRVPSASSSISIRRCRVVTAARPTPQRSGSTTPRASGSTASVVVSVPVARSST